MATVQSSGPKFTGQQDREQLRHDRIVAVIVLLVAALILGALIWLGATGVVPPTDFEPLLMP